jgi:hypothetical protein
MLETDWSEGSRCPFNCKHSHSDPLSMRLCRRVHWCIYRREERRETYIRPREPVRESW